MAEEIKKDDYNLNTDEMTAAGLCFGHRTSKVHPKMKPYLLTVKSGVHIIDIEKTKEKLVEVLDFISKLIFENKVLLLVGTKVQFKELIRNIGQEAKIPYISGRWLGGTFTNFKTIKKRIDYFKELEERKAKGDLEKYTKKERAKMDKELKDLENRFAGIKNLENLPDAILVTDIKKDGLAVKEAKKKGVLVIAIADTNVNPQLADLIIPANDDAISSVSYILGKVKDAIIKSRK